MAGVSQQNDDQQQQGEQAAPPVNQDPPKNNFTGTATGQPIGGQPQPAAPPVPPAEGEEGEEQQGDGKQVLGRGGQPMTPEAISERVERANKQQLRTLTKELGKETDDPEEARKLVADLKQKGELAEKDRKEYERLKRLEEIRKRSRLTAEQRAKQDLEEKERKIQALQDELNREKTTRVVSDQDRIIEGVLSGHVESKFLKYARRDLAEHVNELKEKSPEKLKKFDQKALDKWSADYVKENPQFAKKPPEPEAAPDQAQQPRQPVKRPASTNRSSPRPPTPAPKEGPGQQGGKTVTPGPNAMNKQELREFYKQRGVRIPY